MSSQISCIRCFDQNAPLSPEAGNLVQNGGFEMTDCTPGWLTESWCPKSLQYGCNLSHWTCTGGDINSYPSVFDSTLSLIPEDLQAAYFGNGNAFTCSPNWGDFSCETPEGCAINGFPVGYPYSLPGYGDAVGLSLEQSVSGLTVGHNYVLEFWAGGEPLQGLLPGKGIFAVDLGFGKTYLECKPTDRDQFPVGTVFLIVFTATSPSHTIKFTNWGHVCTDCTELVLDQVKFYPLEELSPNVVDCIAAVDGPHTDQDIQAFPNPFHSILSLRSGIPDDVSLEIYTSASIPWLKQTAAAWIDISTDSWPDGLYYYVIRGKSGIQKTGKLIKL